MPIINVPTPAFRTSIQPGDPSFADSIQPYVQLFELETGIVRAATTNIFDAEVIFEVDTAGTLMATFIPADTGLLTVPGDSNGTLPFSDTLLSVTNSSGNVPVHGKFMQTLQMQFSWGGNDFTDAKKLVQRSNRSSQVNSPNIIESGNSYWEQYGKIVVPHRTVTNVAFQDLLFADVGAIYGFGKSYSEVVSAPPQGSTGVFTLLAINGVSVQPPQNVTANATSLTTIAVKGFGYISGDGHLPFIGGVLKDYAPVPIGPARYNAFIFLPLMGDEIKDLPINIDTWADTLAKLIDAAMKKVGGVTATPYVAHYTEDTSEIYSSLFDAQYKGANILVLGQLFRSSLTFFSADYASNVFNEVPLGQEGHRVFDIAVHARIENGVQHEPDFSAVFNSAYILAGSTNCDFPQSGNITAMEFTNTEFTRIPTSPIPPNGPSIVLRGGTSSNGNRSIGMLNRGPTWRSNVPLVAVKITDAIGGVYAHIGDQRFKKISLDFAVTDMKYDSLSNTLVLGTFDGVYVVKNLQLDKDNTFHRLGTLSTPIVSLQVNWGNSITDTSPVDPAGLLPTGTTVYALCKGGIGTLTGTFSYPMFDPSGHGSSGVPGQTNADISARDGFGGWDGNHIDPNIDKFGILDNKTIYWSDPTTSAGSLLGVNFAHPFPAGGSSVAIYPTDAGESLSHILAVNNYPVSNSGKLSVLFVLTNGVQGSIYIKYTDPNDAAGLIKLDQKIVTSDSGNFIPLSYNVLKVLPPNTTINGLTITALLGTDQGIYYTTDAFPFFQNWFSANAQAGLDSQNISFIAVGKTFNDTRKFANGTTIPVQYSPFIAGDANSYFESWSGGVWWTNRLQDKVGLHATFYDAYFAVYGTYPPPVPAHLEIPLDKIERGDNIFTYPQGPNPPNPANFALMRDRNDLGEFYYYLEEKNIPFMKKGTYVGTASSLSTSTLVDTTTCSNQLFLVTKRWLFENSRPPIKLTLESSFSDRQAALRFLRPMHIVKVWFNQSYYTDDGVQHVFFALENEDFYVLKVTFKLTVNGVKVTVELSSEMQKTRMTPDELAADIQQIVRNLQLRL